MSLKEQGLAFYMNTAAAVLGVAGLVTLVIGNNISEANKMNDFAFMATLLVVGIVAVAAAAAVPNFMKMMQKKGDLKRAILAYAAIALYTVVIARHISARILMISGLFSWNSMNTEGWTVFYLMIASCVCLLAGVIFMIVGAFASTERKPKVKIEVVAEEPEV